MSLLRRTQIAVPAIVALAGVLLLVQPSPSPARANVVCAGGGVVAGGVGAIAGGVIGGANPIQDACNAVSGAVGGAIENPVSRALKGVGNGVFEQVTVWVSDGAAWLIGEVVRGMEESTTPQLTARGFLSQYAKMAAIAALIGMAMLLLAVLEGVAQGNAGMLTRVALVNLPLAFIATSVAYLIVQLLLVATDGLCDAIASASGRNGQRFFEGAISGLSDAGGSAAGQLGGGGGTGATAAEAAVPLFVTFLAAIIGAFAAFLVWLELIMRDAAVYVVALFMPFSLAASIWPRWMGALRRSAELLLVVIASKFVIVAIISLAAGLLADPGEGVEPILAASALLLVACFAPLVLLKLVPFAEGAMSAAYSRRSAAGGGVGAMQLASDAAILRGMMRSNLNEGSGVTLWDAAEKGGGGASPARPSPGGPRGGGGSPAGGPGAGAGKEPDGGSPKAAAAGGGAAAAGGGAPAGAAAGPVAAARGVQAAGKRLGRGAPGGESQAAKPGGATGERVQSQGGEGQREQGEAARKPKAAEKPLRPAPESPGAKPEGAR